MYKAQSCILSIVTSTVPYATKGQSKQQKGSICPSEGLWKHLL